MSESRGILAEAVALIVRAGAIACASFFVLLAASAALIALLVGVISVSQDTVGAVIGIIISVLSIFIFGFLHAGPLAAYAIGIERDEKPALGETLLRALRVGPRLAGPLLATLPAAMTFGIATAAIAGVEKNSQDPERIALLLVLASLCGFAAAWILGVHGLYHAASLVLDFQIVLPRGLREHFVLALPGLVPVATAAALVGRFFGHDTTVSQLLSPGALDIILASGFALGITFSILVSTAVAIVVANRRPEDRV
jgi:hypothetical protein